MAMPDEARKAASDRIARLLTERFPPEGFASFAGYWPFRREFDCLPYLRGVVQAGGRACLPIVIQPRSPLEFRAWTPESRMEKGVWGILHPADGPPQRPAAFLSPLVGFDAEGYRLGYGAGYYDRTLGARQDRPLVIGVGYELQRLATIHPQPHDIPMDWIVTEAGLWETPAGKARRAAI
jgi:5-formyltetrahydrofolate cyclo-ligase